MMISNVNKTSTAEKTMEQNKKTSFAPFLFGPSFTESELDDPDFSNVAADDESSLSTSFDHTIDFNCIEDQFVYVANKLTTEEHEALDAAKKNNEQKEIEDGKPLNKLRSFCCPQPKAEDGSNDSVDYNGSENTRRLATLYNSVRKKCYFIWHSAREL